MRRKREIFFLVLRADMAAHMGTIHLDRPGQGRALALHDETLAQLVHQDEGTLPRSRHICRADSPFTALA
jgi:hypothetical protein